MADVEVVGIEGISKALDKLAKDMYRTVGQNRTLKERASKSTEAAMYLLAPRGETGNLRKSIKFLKFKKSSDAFVGPDYKIGPHAHLVEFGFVHYKDKKKKDGWKGIGFIRRSYEKTKHIVLAELTRLAKKEFDKIGRTLEVK